MSEAVRETPHRHDPATLEAASADLLYEAKRLFIGAKLVPEIAASGVEELRLLVLEAVLLHFRVLMDFFYPRKTIRNTDMVVADYLDRMPVLLQNEPEWLQRYRDRLDQLLSHLTTHRLKYKEAGEMDWADLPQRLSDMVAMWRAFLEALPPERRKWFDAETQL